MIDARAGASIGASVVVVEVRDGVALVAPFE
jgi:hypothetical protein